MRRLMEEEDAKYKESEQKLIEAAKVIIKHWR